MLWILCFVFRSCCHITSCKMKCSVWFGSCWRPRTDKETYGFWSRRSRRCLAIVRAILRWKRTTTKRQTWMIYSEENFRTSSRIKPNNLKTWINSKFGTRNFQLPVLVSTLNILHLTSKWSLVHLKPSSQLLSFLIVCLCCNFRINKTTITKQDLSILFA